MKVVCNQKCFGFRGKYWNKGDSEVIQEGEEFPIEYFDRADGKPHEEKKSSKKSKEELDAEKAELKAKADAEKKAKEEAGKNGKPHEEKK